MTKSIPTIQKYMTRAPYSIGDDQPLSLAGSLMAAHDIRHLPVLHGGRLRGILTDRDLRLVASFPDVDLSKTAVEDAMTELPFTVPPEAPLDEVVREMATRKYGSAVIVDHQKVVGIFTTVDACEALADLLEL